MTRSNPCLRAIALVATALTGRPGHAQEPPLHHLDTIPVELARLGSGGVPLGRAPFAVHVLPERLVTTPGAATIVDALASIPGSSTASQFGSPVQPDLRLRGFQVGPVVGFPQSVSVFVDGVRVNEPDASQVNFDLIPVHVAERIEVIRSPGGPFGRNTLAGAINVVTRRGDPDTRGLVEIGAGSFGTVFGHGWLGGRLLDRFDYLVSARHRESDGWRDLSRSEIRQLFGKLGYQDGASDVSLSYTFSDNYVEGPGSLPRSWLAGELPPGVDAGRDPRTLQFTGFEGDYFDPRLHFAVLNGSRQIGSDFEIRLNMYMRSNEFTQFNDNVSEANARGETGILSVGATLQIAGSLDAGMRWTAGAEAVRNDSEISIFEVPNGAFPDVGGTTERVSSEEDDLGVFAHLWWPVGGRGSLSGSLRYDHVSLPVTDHLDPEHSGRNRFSQVTGSLGGEVVLTDALRGFAAYGRGFRAPVILEISCADPEDPCPLPFELGADPPLEAVTTDTWQSGLRFVGLGETTAELAVFWAEVHDDLFAVVLPPSTRGYFTNLDRTRRLGLEANVGTRLFAGLEVRATLGLTRATFRTDAMLASALLADDEDDEDGSGAGESGARELDPEGGDHGAVRVEPGDRFAMIPALTAGGGLAYDASGWRFEIEGSFVGEQYFIGDEGNDEEFGKLDSYFVLNGAAERRVRDFTVFLRAENLLDSEYATFGIISPNVRGPVTEPQPFLSPGRPFNVVAGVRYSH